MFCVKQQTFEVFHSSLLLLYCIILYVIYWFVIDMEGCHVQSLQIMLAFHGKPGAYECVWHFDATPWPTLLGDSSLSQACIIPRSHSSPGMQGGESALSFIFELDEGRWVWGGSSQAWQLWKVLQAFQCSPWPRIRHMCSKMIVNVCVGCACVSKTGLWVKMRNASQLIRLTVFPCAQESHHLLPKGLGEWIQWKGSLYLPQTHYSITRELSDLSVL